MLTLVGPRNYVSDKGAILPGEAAILRGNVAAHCKSIVSCVKTAEPIEMPFRMKTQFIDDTVEPFYLPGINSLIIMCIGIIRNSSLVGGRASATERVTLYCTWRPSALTTRPHGHYTTTLTFYFLRCGYFAF